MVTVGWGPFKRALATGYRCVIPAVKVDSVLDPLAPLLIDDKYGGVTLTRWLQFATYFSCEGWKMQDLWPPISFNAALVLLEQPWFHGPITFNDTVDILLMCQAQLSASDINLQQQQQLPMMPPLSSSGSPSTTPPTPAPGTPMCYLLRYSETCWESNFWTLSFTTSKGVKSVRIAHHRAHEETVMLYVPVNGSGSSGISPGSSPSLAASNVSSPSASPQQGMSSDTSVAATASPSVSAQSSLVSPVASTHLACVPLFRGATGMTRFAKNVGSQRVAASEESLIPLDFFYILLPRQPGVLTVVYSSLTELLACKYSSYIPAQRRRAYTDDPFAFFCSDSTEASFR